MKLVVLVGFSKGLGKAIFDQLLKGLKPGERELLALGRKTKDFPQYNSVIYQEADLLKDDCWDSLSQYIPSNTESLDLFINASVIEPIAVVGSLDSYQLESAVKVNYISPMKLVNQLLFLQQKGKFTLNIFNISSGASSRPIEGWALYCSTKAAFKMFLDVADAEAQDILHITHIDPGVIDTDMQRTIRSKSNKEMKNVQQFRALSHSNKLKSPQEAARDVLAYSELS